VFVGRLQTAGFSRGCRKGPNGFIVDDVLRLADYFLYLLGRRVPNVMLSKHHPEVKAV